ncbi:MAG: hypothetical protein HPY57_15515 [Ignavibacteria bacterium]|nr:hypothetical protein [Ignavibacteria bacterium]
MILKKVTFTGVDDWTNTNHMVDIWKKNKWVEWGYLYSKNLNGVEKRYPNVKKLIQHFKSEGYFMNRSLHLCGSVVQEILSNGLINYDITYLMTGINRVQLNFNLKQSHINIIKFFSFINRYPNPFILQINDNNKPFINAIIPYVNEDRFHFLFDISNDIKEIPKPIEGRICGWTGGLSPDNLEQKLIQLEEQLPKDLGIWIDIETGVRTDDYFDLSKVEKCCEIINKFNYIKR